jgi:N-acetylglutamate synthase-like GNAT family acetyltransferase
MIEYLEQEMELLHRMQMRNMLPNPHKLIFSSDMVTIIMSSFDWGMIAHSELKNNDEHCYVRQLYIIADIRKKGIGSAKIRDLKNDCLYYNIKRIEVEADNNSDAFWIKNGFNRIENDKYNRMFLNL